MFENFYFKKTCRKTRSRAEKREIIDKHPQCVYCGCKDYDTLVLDHIAPISRGGEDIVSNLTVSCISCNSHKSNFPIEVFLKKLVIKQDKLITELNKRNYELDELRMGRPCHYMHTEDRLLSKINDAVKRLFYFKRIIQAIVDEQYKIF